MSNQINFNSRKNLIESKSKALAGLAEIAQIANQAAGELQVGELTRSPVELMLEFAEQLKPLEQFRDDELSDALAD